MGNYLANSLTFYKDNMAAVALPFPSKTDVIKQSDPISKTLKFFSVVHQSAVVTMESLKNDCKNRNYVLSKTVHDKLSIFPYFSKIEPTANKISKEKVETNGYSTIFGISSHWTFNPNFQMNAEKSDSILSSNPSHCCPSSRPGQNTFFLTSLIKMVETQETLKTVQEAPMPCKDSEVTHRAGVSFFVDFHEPYIQYPLNERYNFALHNDCDSSSSGDSFCSIEFLCNNGTALCDEDFIVFEEQIFDEADDFYEFRVTLNDYVQMDSLKCLKESLRCSVNSRNTPDTARFSNESTESRCSINFKNSETATCSNLVPRKSEDNASNMKQKNISNGTPRKVRFQTEVTLHYMKHWDFAYREARKGPWELAAADRCRFRRRIQDLEPVISPCLQQKLQSIKKL